MTKAEYFQVDGRVLKLTHLEKIFFPRAGFRKRDVLRYYKEIGPTVLPYLKDRPFTFLRYPMGVDAPAFYQKQCPEHRPKWLKTGRLRDVCHCLLNDLPSLLWANNLAAIELHTTLGLIRDIERPTCIALDFDPGEGADIRDCIEVVLLVRRHLDRLGLESFPKTSGKKGLHLYIPLNTPITYGETKPFARALAELMEKEHPDLVVSRMLKKYRHGRVFVDWSQNTDFKTTTTVYSLRANDWPTVSTPLQWKEVLAASRSDSRARRLLQIEADEALSRVKKKGDLFAPVLTMKQRLPEELAIRRAA